MLFHHKIAYADIKILIHSGKITYGGNQNLGIYGTLNYISGKRMKLENRVFFTSEKEAIGLGFRPCGHGMKKAYISPKLSLLMKDIIIHSLLGTTTYQSNFIDLESSQTFFEYLYHEIPWTHDSAKIYGKTIITKRKIAWYADKSYNYDYSGTSRIALPWNETIRAIGDLLERETGYRFNSCLLNLYHTGEEGMAWHSDDQNHLEPDSPVAIISFGAERFFRLRRTQEKTEQYKIMLNQGSLLMMLGETQKHWQHKIPKMARIKTPRISLTWRIMHPSKLQ